MDTVTQAEPTRLFYTASEMARRCGVSKVTWYRWVKAGEAPSPVYVGKIARWPADMIDKWVVGLRRKVVAKE